MKYYKLMHYIFSSHILYYLIFLGFILYVYFKSSSSEVHITDFLDFTIITSLILTVLVSQMSILLSKRMKRKIEETSKLTVDYEKLLSKYPRCEKLISYENSNKANYLKGRRYTTSKRVEKDNRDTYRFPITAEIINKHYQFIIEDCDKHYSPPETIKDNFNELMAAHNQSNIYNQMTIRLDDFDLIGNTLKFQTSRTSYFNTLLTNRAMDYRLGKLYSNRELFSPGPFLEELKESHFSNHLGFNGFVETADNKIILIIRSKYTSIGKEALGASVSASLKAKYALDENKRLTTEGLEKGIKMEIYDELKITEDFYNFSLTENIISLYRDVVEGGKPHLLFHIKLNIDSTEVAQNFKKVIRKEKSNSVNIDGKKLVFANRDELEYTYITPDTVILGKKVYRTLPYTAASLVMLINYLEK